MQGACADYDENRLQVLMKAMVPEWSGVIPEFEQTAVAVRSEGSVVALPRRPALH
jgi:hypothetical protein